MIRRTKIIATLGPATDQEEQLEGLIAKGVDLVRLNFSHGDASLHLERAKKVRKIAEKKGIHVGIIADLQGPKIRVGQFKNGSVVLKAGQPFDFIINDNNFIGDVRGVFLDYPGIIQDIEVGKVIVLDDGRIRVQVKEMTEERVICDVLVGGELSDAKGMNIEGGGLSAPSFTAKDEQDLKVAVEMKADFVALSFVKEAQDIADIKKRLVDEDHPIQIIAKIETNMALSNIDAITEAADGIMIARGDLAVEIGAEKVPAMQKKLVECSRLHAKPVIVATQMMESMIHDTTPTRAEVSDVANAVLDGVDAVMLSAETAIGKHPCKVVGIMDSICLNVEPHVDLTPTTLLDRSIGHIHEGIAFAAMYTANQLGAKCLAALTESGTTARWMSRIRSNKVIYGLSRHPETLARMALYKGVVPMPFDVLKYSYEQISQEVVEHLVKAQCVSSGEYIVMTKGDHLGIHGGTNSMKVLIAT